jgi:hypothetical protein
MPIRINLKEIFPSDSQDITVDKLNFNFNKLLALGIGDQGDQGTSGPQGAAGPVGLSGTQGLRGSTWFVDAGDPNTLTFVDLLDQDLYLDTVTFSVWQYDETTTTWSQVLNFSSIVNYYISLSPSPFNRGFGIGSPQDDRFITFNRRGNDYVNSQNDVTRGSFNTADSDVLFLSNFNESTIANAIGFPNFPASPGDAFDALLKVYVNHTEGASEVTGRYHLEMGSLYLDNSSPAEVAFSSLKHNLKGKFKKNEVTLTTSIPSTNTWVNIAQFSLSVPEPESITGIDQNGIFEFVMPKWNSEGTPIQDEIRVWMGSAEGMSEYVGLTEKEIGDGIVVADLTTAASFGIMKGLGNNFNVNYSNDDFLLINTNGLDGIFINNKVVQTNGTFDIVHSDKARFLSKTLNGGLYDGNVNKHLSSVFSNGKLIITTWAGQNSVLVAEPDESGRLNVYHQESTLTLTESSTFDSEFVDLTPPGGPNISPTYDNHGHQSNGEYQRFPTTNLTHIDFVGKYMFATRVRPQNLITGIGSGYNRSTLLVAELDSNGNVIRNVGFWGDSGSSDEYYAKKVQVIGNIAYVLTKKQATSDWTESDSYLHAVDITDPTNPTTLDKVTTLSDDNYLDFAVLGERAFITAYDDAADQILLIRIDIHDPNNLDAGASPLTVVTSTTELPTPIKAEGTRVYIGHNNKLYVYSSDYSNDSSMSSGSLISGGFTVDADLVISDIIVNGNYVYVLGENSSTGFGELYTLDVSTIATPIVVGFDSRSTLTAPGKMTLVGNKIYATSSQGTGGLSTTDGGLSVFEIDGVVSPSATISTIKSNEIKVKNNVYIGERLDVGNSINVGSGGIYVDQGRGLSSDGPVTSTINVVDSGEGAFNMKLNSVDLTDRSLLGFDTQIYDITQTSPSTSPTINVRRTKIEDSSFADGVIIDNVDLRDSGTFSSFTGFNIARLGGTHNFSSFTGFRTVLGSSATDNISGNSYGSNIVLNNGVNLTGSANFYGYRFFFGGSNSGSGTVYGLHISGAEENYIEGTLQMNGSTKVKKEWHGTLKFNYNIGAPNAGNGSGITSIDETYLPAGFSNDGAITDMNNSAASPGFVRITMPPGAIDSIDLNKTIVHVTPRYDGTYADSTDYVITPQVNSTTSLNFYFNRIINAATTTGDVAFSFTVIEYE